MKITSLSDSPVWLKNEAAILFRRYLSEKRGLREVITPKLSPSSGIEPFIDALSVHSCNRSIHEKKPRYLSTSPEFSLKKMYALFYSHTNGVFEIANAFRADQKSRLHYPEFTMLEWYETNSKYTVFAERVHELLSLLEDELIEPGGSAEALNGLNQKKQADRNTPISVQTLFSDILKTDIQPDTDLNVYQELALSLNINKQNIFSNQRLSFYQEEYLKTLYFQLIFDNCIMPHLKEGVWHIKDFPPFLRGMSSLNNNGWSERIECYIQGIEVSNGYQECWSPQEVREIWRYNNEIRALEGKKPHGVDEMVVETSPKLKGVSGIAIGLERMLMALWGITDIRNFFCL